MCIFPKLQSVMLPFTYVCVWKCCTSIKALFFLFTKFYHTKLRTVRLLCIFITRTHVPYPYLSNNYVPCKRTVIFAAKWSVLYRTCVPYRTAILAAQTAQTTVNKWPLMDIMSFLEPYTLPRRYLACCFPFFTLTLIQLIICESNTPDDPMPPG